VISVMILSSPEKNRVLTGLTLAPITKKTSACSSFILVSGWLRLRRCEDQIGPDTGTAACTHHPR